MNLLRSAIAIAIIGSALVPSIANGQAITPERSAGRAARGVFELWGERSGVSRPVSRAALRNVAGDSVPELSLSQRSDTVKSSRTPKVIIGALVGGAAGLAAGLLLDHTGKSGGSGSGEHVTYTFEVDTVPIGAIIGAATALLVNAH
jgi:hypothetical protein